MEYEAVIGLEVHLHLKTRTKAFCGCSTEFGSQPNTQTCPVCLGFPGSLPVFNKTALDYGIKVALALNCKVQEYTKFDRKHYFYPDLPKNYQISQYDLPLSKNGFVEIEIEGHRKTIGITRVHMEEDAGKLIHRGDESMVDFNRAGVPLLEIVSEPDINSPLEAYEYLTRLKNIIEYLDVSDCDMEKGSLRCDANVSVMQRGSKEFGTKTEVKNMNSFKGVRDALAYEIERQIEVIQGGGQVIQETRLWDAERLQTVSMRTKEGAQDYRYFPEPDLAPFLITNEKIEEIRETIPELPQERKKRFISDYGLSEYDANILISTKENADYSEGCINAYAGKNKKALVNFLIGPLLFEANSRGCDLRGLNIPEDGFVELVGFLDRQEISNLTAKSVLTEMIATKAAASKIIQEKGLAQVSDTAVLEAQIDEAIKANPKSVQDYKVGKENALMFLVGQVMKATKGKANPKVVQDMLRRRV